MLTSGNYQKKHLQTNFLNSLLIVMYLWEIDFNILRGIEENHLKSLKIPQGHNVTMHCILTIKEYQDRLKL